MRMLNLAVRFGCELAALVAFVWWGWPLVGWLVAAAVAVMWGLVVAPKATHRLPDPPRLLVELVIFASAIVAFYEAVDFQKPKNGKTVVSFSVRFLP